LLYIGNRSLSDM